MFATQYSDDGSPDYDDPFEAAWDDFVRPCGFGDDASQTSSDSNASEDQFQNLQEVSPRVHDGRTLYQTGSGVSSDALHRASYSGDSDPTESIVDEWLCTASDNSMSEEQNHSLSLEDLDDTHEYERRTAMSPAQREPHLYSFDDTDVDTDNCQTLELDTLSIASESFSIWRDGSSETHNVEHESGLPTSPYTSQCNDCPRTQILRPMNVSTFWAPSDLAPATLNSAQYRLEPPDHIMTDNEANVVLYTDNNTFDDYDDASLQWPL